MNIQTFHTAIGEMKLASILLQRAEHYMLRKPEEESFHPFCDLIADGWTKYAKTHPDEPTVFKNGVYIGDDSNALGAGVIYASKNIDISKMLPDCDDLPQIMVNEFRYDLCTVFYRYLQNMKRDGVPLPFIWNQKTFNWDNFYRLTNNGKEFGETLTL